jgi:hypothetical protein
MKIILLKATTKVSGLEDMLPRQGPEGIAGIDDQPSLGGRPGVIIGRVVGHQQHLMMENGIVL